MEAMPTSEKTVNHEKEWLELREWHGDKTEGEILEMFEKPSYLDLVSS